jgi:hypothetical protein
MTGWKWDYQHVLILAGYALGAGAAGGPLVAEMFVGGHPNPMVVLMGVGTLLTSAVFGFIKHPPSSIEEAVVEGEQNVKPLNPPEPPLQ